MKNFNFSYSPTAIRPHRASTDPLQSADPGGRSFQVKKGRYVKMPSNEKSWPNLTSKLFH